MTTGCTVRKGMTRILDGIMKYRHTLRPSLLDEFKKVVLGPSVRIFSFNYIYVIEKQNFILARRTFANMR